MRKIVLIASVIFLGIQLGKAQFTSNNPRTVMVDTNGVVVKPDNFASNYYAVVDAATNAVLLSAFEVFTNSVGGVITNFVTIPVFNQYTTDVASVIQQATSWQTPIDGMAIPDLPTAYHELIPYLYSPGAYGNAMLVDRLDTGVSRNEVDWGYAEFTQYQMTFPTTGGKWGGYARGGDYSSYIQYGFPNDWVITQSTDFTVSWWQNTVSYTGSNTEYRRFRIGSLETTNNIQYKYSDRKFTLWDASGSSVEGSAGSTHSMSSGTWYHFCVSYEAATQTLRLFFNGNQTATLSVIGYFFTMGADDFLKLSSDGYGTRACFDDVVLEIGTKITSNFTPPTEPFGSSPPPPRMKATTFTLDDVQLLSDHAFADAISAESGLAIGTNAVSTGTAIQLGEGTNTTTQTFQVFDHQLLDASGNVPTNVMYDSFHTLLDESYIMANEVEWVEEVNGIYVDNIPSASQDKMLFIDIPSVYGNTVLLENFDNETRTAGEYRNDVDGSYPLHYGLEDFTVDGKWNFGYYGDGGNQGDIIYPYKSTWGTWTEATPFKISFWIKRTTATASQTRPVVVFDQVNSGSYGSGLVDCLVYNDGLTVYSDHMSGGHAVNSVYPVDTWVYTELSWNPGTGFLSIYIDGVFKSSKAMTGSWTFLDNNTDNDKSQINIINRRLVQSNNLYVDEIQISLNDPPLTSNYTPPTEPLGVNAPPPRLTQTDFTIDDIQGAIAATNHTAAGAVGATTGFAAGDGAEATSGGAVGEGAYAETSGGAIGYMSDTTTGFAGGDSAASQEGGAVGEGAYAETGGAIGQNAYAESGGAVGASTITTTGFAGGTNAVSITGGAIGQNANTQSGGAVGYNTSTVTGFAGGTSTSSARGGAVGESARAVDGFAGGMNAVASVGRAIQLGIGTNSVSSTLKVFEWPLLTDAGKLDPDRLTGLNFSAFTFYTTGADGTGVVTNEVGYYNGLLYSWETNGTSIIFVDET